jgi:hypothetical protein
MHEPFEPRCSHCRRFIYCFDKDGPLADWGYCQQAMANGQPGEDKLRRMEEAARRGDYAVLFARGSPFYQETDDGCADYAPR